MDAATVLSQLRCCGVVVGVRVCGGASAQATGLARGAEGECMALYVV